MSKRNEQKRASLEHTDDDRKGSHASSDKHDTSDKHCKSPKPCKPCKPCKPTKKKCCDDKKKCCEVVLKECNLGDVCNSLSAVLDPNTTVDPAFTVTPLYNAVSGCLSSVSWVATTVFAPVQTLEFDGSLVIENPCCETRNLLNVVVQLKTKDHCKKWITLSSLVKNRNRTLDPPCHPGGTCAGGPVYVCCCDGSGCCEKDCEEVCDSESQRSLKENGKRCHKCKAKGIQNDAASVSLTLTDKFGNPVFADGSIDGTVPATPVYIKPKTCFTLNYEASFNNAILNLLEGSKIRLDVIVTLGNADSCCKNVCVNDCFNPVDFDGSMNSTDASQRYVQSFCCSNKTCVPAEDQCNSVTVAWEDPIVRAVHVTGTTGPSGPIGIVTINSTGFSTSTPTTSSTAVVNSTGTTTVTLSDTTTVTLDCTTTDIADLLFNRLLDVSSGQNSECCCLSTNKYQACVALGDDLVPCNPIISVPTVSLG